MALQRGTALQILVVLLLTTAAVQARWLETEGQGRRMLTKNSSLLDTCSIQYDQSFSSSRFPEGFKFGAATAAYQIEGATSEDGRGPSIWDIFAAIPGNIADGANANIADDSYHKYMNDIELLKAMGMTTYRFSISWPRVLPDGTGRVHSLGIEYYNNVINALLAADITPAVTLYHWDLPEALQSSMGGWLNSSISEYFEEYASLCFSTFGDRVKTWITFNEPQTAAVQGYATGDMAPGRCTKRSNCKEGNSSTEPYIVAHNMLRSHAAAVNIYRSEFQFVQKGRIGITLDCQFYFPATDSAEDKLASETALEFSYGWFADPVLFGDYPAVMKEHVGERLPEWSAVEKELLRNSVDFLGVNSYTGTYVTAGSPPPAGTGTPWSDSWVSTSQTSENGVPIGDSTGSDWLKVVPSAIYNLIMWIHQRYVGVPVLITENGTSDPGDAPLSRLLCDQQRISFYESYLKNLLQAIRDGAPVQAYYAWSLLDNFEWARGYTERFGLHYVDFNNPNRPRTPKASALWWSDFLGSDKST